MQLDPDWLSDFPKLRAEDFRETSPATAEYNCIAWAAGDSDRWWWPGWSYYWPRNAPRERSVEAFVRVYSLSGYQHCGDGLLENGFEKVAIYAKAGKPTHVARQLMNGEWTSKLGQDVDITHVKLSCLEGGIYGHVQVFLKRPRGDG